MGISEGDSRKLLAEMQKHQLLDIIDQQRDLLKKAKEYREALQETKTVEYREGIFQEQIIKHGESEKRKTKKMKRNPEKVILTYLGNIEFFSYPFSSENKVYARIGKEITAINKYEAKSIIAIYNVVNWALDGGITKSVRGESKSKLSEKVKSAYNEGFQNMRKSEKKLKDKREAFLKSLRENYETKKEKTLKESKGNN